MPLKTALRNTFFLPKASSRPCGQVAKISHSAAATTIRMMNAHNGWRSMNFVMGATRVASAPGREQAAGLRQPVRDDGLMRSTPCRPLSSAGATVVRRPSVADPIGLRDPDLIVSILSRAGLAGQARRTLAARR